MKFTTALSALALALASSTSFVAAAPIQTRDVWDPKVLYPHAGTVWEIGSYHNVTWDTSNPPVNVSNGAAIYLRKGGSTLLDEPLAQGFDLHDGRIEVHVPTDIDAGTDYRIVLFGDSGNWSDEFTIEA